MADSPSELFDPGAWERVPGFDFVDITYHRAVDTGAVRIAFDRPEATYADKSVCVTVKIETHKGKPQIVARGPSQIELR